MIKYSFSLHIKEFAKVQILIHLANRNLDIFMKVLLHYKVITDSSLSQLNI